jgi:hypothetical protein
MIESKNETARETVSERRIVSESEKGSVRRSVKGNALASRILLLIVRGIDTITAGTLIANTAKRTTARGKAVTRFLSQAFHKQPLVVWLELLLPLA